MRYPTHPLTRSPITHSPVTDSLVTHAPCHQGLGVPVDMDTAIEWYQKAAEGGNEAAMRDLGLCYQTGVWVRQEAALSGWGARNRVCVCAHECA